MDHLVFCVNSAFTIELCFQPARSNGISLLCTELKCKYRLFFLQFSDLFLMSQLKILTFYLTLFYVHRMTICNLYTMPRMPEPVWLTMMSGALKKNQLCGHFMHELSLLMEQASKNQLSTFNKT